MSQVRAVYEFEAQPNSGELSISVNEILTVIREGIEGGWLEGRNAKGQHGLFPESYVEKIESIPALPQVTTTPAHNPPTYAVPPVEINWSIPPVPSHYPQLPTSFTEQDVALSRSLAPVHDDDDFDDWTEDDEELSENVANIGDPLEPQTHASKIHSAGNDSTLAKQGTVRMKNINRFSNFVKSGMESYILLTSKVTSKSEEFHEIVLTSDGVGWIPVAQPYYCTVDKPKKESKLKGLKSFIAYSVTSSLSGIQVSRRYKHFDWLHEQMSAKYILIPIPPLPEKQVAGRYEEDLIEHRKNILQIWVNKVCKHPVLSKSDVWIHFVTCTDEKKWKNGKRKAEKDEYVGGNFFHCVTVPKIPLDSSDVEQKVENFSRSMRSLDESVRVLHDRISETHKRLTGPYRTNWHKLGASFLNLSNSFELDSSSKNGAVKNALKETAEVFQRIGDEHEESAKTSLDPLLDALYAYKGILACMPDIINVHKSAMSKLRENEKLAMEGRLSSADMEKVKGKVDTISYVMLAEIAFQNREREEDFKNMMTVFLGRQAAFYKNIGQQLDSLAQTFKKV